MKLPSIRKGQVQRLATVSPMAVVSTAAAQAASAAAIPDVIRKTVSDVYRMDAAAEYQKNLGNAQEQLQAAEHSLLNNQYVEGEEGELVSQHRELSENYGAVESKIRENILSKTNNPLARNKLASVLSDRKLKTNEKIVATADDWARSDSHRNLTQAIDQNLKLGDYEGAEKAFVSGVVTGAFSDNEIEQIPRKIIQHQQYGELSTGIETSAATENFLSSRNNINSNLIVSDTQKRGLNSELDQKIENSLVAATRATVEERGIVMGDKFIKLMNNTNFEKLGYASEEGKYQAISRMQSVLKDYQAGLKTDREALKLQDRVDCIASGCPADPKSKVDKKAMSAVFDSAITKEDGEKEEPLSEVYMDAARNMAVVQGWVPEDVKTDIRAYLQHIKPGNVIKGSKALLELDAVAPRSVLEFDRKDISFGLTLNDYASRGVVEETTIAKIREGIYKVPNAMRAGRKDNFNKTIKRESVKILKDLVADDDQANPWFEFAADFPDDMRLEFESVFRDEYVLSGNESVAARAAYRTMRNIWGVSDRSGDLNLERNNPESIYGGGKPLPALTEQFNLDMEGVGLDPEKVGLELDPSAPESKRWVIFDKETNDVKLNEDGTIMMWSYDYNSSPEADRQRKKADKVRKGAEWRIKRDKEIASAKTPMNLEQFYDADELGQYSEDKGQWATDIATATNQAAVEAWEFVLKDTPEWWGSWKMPHKREWAKKARGEK